MKILFSRKLKQFVEMYKSRKAFCERFDIDEATLSNILAGRRSVPADIIAKIQKETEMTFSEAFETKGE